MISTKLSNQTTLRAGIITLDYKTQIELRSTSDGDFSFYFQNQKMSLKEVLDKVYKEGSLMDFFEAIEFCLECNPMDLDSICERMRRNGISNLGKVNMWHRKRQAPTARPEKQNESLMVDPSELMDDPGELPEQVKETEQILENHGH